jgi:hypothetical protein
MFDVNFKKLVMMLLPTFLRRDVMLAWLCTLTAPLITLHNTLMLRRTNTLYELNINGQVCRLRKALNDAFNLPSGTIRIEDPQEYGAWIFALDEGVEPQLIAHDGANAAAWDVEAINAERSSFVVITPSHLHNANDEARLKAILNTFKLVSRNFKIIYE